MHDVQSQTKSVRRDVAVKRARTQPQATEPPPQQLRAGARPSLSVRNGHLSGVASGWCEAAIAERGGPKKKKPWCPAGLRSYGVVPTSNPDQAEKSAFENEAPVDSSLVSARKRQLTMNDLRVTTAFRIRSIGF